MAEQLKYHDNNPVRVNLERARIQLSGIPVHEFTPYAVRESDYVEPFPGSTLRARSQTTSLLEICVFKGTPQELVEQSQVTLGVEKWLRRNNIRPVA